MYQPRALTIRMSQSFTLDEAKCHLANCILCHCCLNLVLNCVWLFLPKLYGDFADVFDLYECQLAIVHCAGHYEQQLVQSLWQQIIDKGMIAHD